jgi:TolB-like protein/DNA-binding winged helix-turn-helix (wHTH) protein/tetratricopeptide (TPR) repeat protein
VEDSEKIRFDGWTLSRRSGELTRGGQRSRLQDHPLTVLVALLDRPGELVTREELIRRLWPNQVVDYDTALNAAVRRLRAALGDDADTPRYVETLPRRGYRFIGSLDPSPPALPPAMPQSAAEVPAIAPPGRRADARLIAVVAVAGLFLAAAAWLTFRDHRDPAVGPEAGTPRSIVVLPFVSLSTESVDQLFADGLTEELINRLARNDDLKVIARTSSFALRDPDLDIRAVADRLGVTHVLEGSVRRSGDRLRVTAQLIDATSSSHLWSQNYDRRMGDMFDIQDDIAVHVAAALDVRLDPGPAAGHRPDPRAYERYLLARHFFSRRGPGDVERARDYFQEAADRDPEFASAWAGLASSWWILVADGVVDREKGLAELDSAAQRALLLDPRQVEALARLALRAWALDDTESMHELRRRASEIDPDHPLVLPIAAQQASRRGEPQDAVALYRRLIARDPLSAVNHHNLSWELYTTGRYDEAIVEARKVADLSPAHSRGIECLSLVKLGRHEEARSLALAMHDREDRLQCLGMAAHGLGDGTQADAALGDLIRDAAADSAVQVAELLAFRGETAAAFDWLARNREYCATAPGLLFQCARSYPQRSPFLAPLRDDPRWREVVEPR